MERCSPLVLSLCGLDGVGKTSLFEGLKAQTPGDDVIFRPRGPATIERKVEAHFPRRFGDHRDWIVGDFAQAIALACALDYADYHAAQIAPLFDQERERPSVIVTDRHAICFVAYAQCLETPSRPATTLLQSIRPPDLILHVTLDEAINRTRSKPARVQNDPFEHPDCQARLAGAYQRVLDTCGVPVVEIRNDGTIDESIAKARAVLQPLLVRHQDD